MSGGIKKMKTKIVGIFVCMLLIGATTVTIADWSVGDGHKMHYPQLPDPNGWDVDFHDWQLADDWRCSKSGPVEDIHFWISWYHDMNETIPWIKVSIYSNNPGPPSTPAELLWSKQFTEDEFIIAGPWDGDQGWLWPQGDYEEHNHQLYWQINIPKIDQPFEQTEGEIYWLVIGMPYYDPPIAVGWKTSLDHFMDAAVWGAEPNWAPIYDPINGEQIDFAFVITGGEEPEECCLAIDSMVGGLFAPTASLKVNSVIKNVGGAECKDIRWKYYTTGGVVLWGPKSGTVASLLPGDTVTVTSRIFIGLAIPGIFPGNVTIEADATNNACPPATMTKGLFLLILLLDLV
jgi:hypothetical protein